MKPLKMTEECEAEVRAMAAIFAPEADASTLRVALVVSVAEIDALRAELDRCAEHLRSSVEDEEALVGEIDALHRLPVIEWCGQCRAMQTDEHYNQEADGYRDVRGSEHCARDAAKRSVLPLLSDDRERHMPPPDWCPLRDRK